VWHITYNKLLETVDSANCSTDLIKSFIVSANAAAEGFRRDNNV